MCVYNGGSMNIAGNKHGEDAEKIGASVNEARVPLAWRGFSQHRLTVCQLAV